MNIACERVDLRGLQGFFVFSFLGVFFLSWLYFFHLELKRNWRCPITPLDHWRCSLSSRTMADEAISWWRFNTRTGNFQCHSKKSENDCGSCFWEVKGRFRCMLKRIDSTLKCLPAKIASCVVLHNLCEMREEAFSEEWLIPEGFDDDSSVASELQIWGRMHWEMLWSLLFPPLKIVQELFLHQFCLYF